MQSVSDMHWKNCSYPNWPALLTMLLPGAQVARWEHLFVALGWPKSNINEEATVLPILHQPRFWNLLGCVACPDNIFLATLIKHGEYMQIIRVSETHCMTLKKGTEVENWQPIKWHLHGFFIPTEVYADHITNVSQLERSCAYYKPPFYLRDLHFLFTGIISTKPKIFIVS